MRGGLTSRAAAMVFGGATALAAALPGACPAARAAPSSAVLRLPPLAPGHAADQGADESRMGAPLRIGLVRPVDVEAAERGAWRRDAASGGSTWELVVESPGAAALGLEVDASRLPDRARLLFGSETGALGPAPPGWRRGGARWLPQVEGDAVRLRLELPAGAAPEGAPFRVLRAAHGWRGPAARAGAALPKSGACEVDVACPAAEGWRDPIRSVGLITHVDGAFLYLCSGQLVMDVPRSFRPWFLTAAHCGLDASNGSSAVVYWNYEASSCGGQRDGSLADAQSGAILRWSDAASDTALLELSVAPSEDFGVHHAGWDASDAVPGGVVGIHHPNGDEKAISISDRSLQATRNCIDPRWLDSHWWVRGWDLGVTESGSSGSGIWDAGSARLVGVLSGGSSFCDTPEGFDCYGRFAVAWSRGLAAWLDPDASGTLSLEGADPPPPCEGDDADSDGVPDACDGCPALPDPEQADLDGDGVGDACDGCLRHPDPSQEDSDGDGRTNGCDFLYGDLAPTGSPDARLSVADVLRLLRAAVALEELTGRDFEAGNVAPALISEGAPATAAPTGEAPRVIDVLDVQLLLRAAVGLLAFEDPA